jgi:hypothetical protein
MSIRSRLERLERVKRLERAERLERRQPAASFWDVMCGVRDEADLSDADKALLRHALEADAGRDVIEEMITADLGGPTGPPLSAGVPSQPAGRQGDDQD